MSNSRKYAAEFKREAVQLALNSPSIVGAAKDLGIPHKSHLKKGGDLLRSGEVGFY